MVLMKTSGVYVGRRKMDEKIEQIPQPNYPPSIKDWMNEYIRYWERGRIIEYYRKVIWDAYPWYKKLYKRIQYRWEDLWKVQ